mmetsp:Transcript_24831/g.72745  ORF Transcript_24831/g.72745 Transcript_24831/m.72745 type:complete len:236 (+) Transcript_24831:364-1071(+)
MLRRRPRNEGGRHWLRRPRRGDASKVGGEDYGGGGSRRRRREFGGGGRSRRTDTGGYSEAGRDELQFGHSGLVQGLLHPRRGPRPRNHPQHHRDRHAQHRGVLRPRRRLPRRGRPVRHGNALPRRDHRRGARRLLVQRRDRRLGEIPLRRRGRTGRGRPESHEASERRTGGEPGTRQRRQGQVGEGRAGHRLVQLAHGGLGSLVGLRRPPQGEERAGDAPGQVRQDVRSEDQAEH